MHTRHTLNKKNLACKYENVKSYAKADRNNMIEDNIVKDVQKFFRLKRKNNLIENKIIRNIRTRGVVRGGQKGLKLSFNY